MLKRFYSKRSGFTLVEIIVAFAVFAIMASMVAQILELSIKARNANNQYALELARQEKILTVIQKDSALYNDSDKTGEYNITLTKGGKSLTLGYQVKATDPTAVNQAEGINYFLSPVDYECKPGSDGDPTMPDSSGADGMSQAARMDTRITGTSGIGGITIYNVVKDEYDYPDDSPFKLAPGHTRYFFEVSASSKDSSGKYTLWQEDVPYAQYRFYFYYADKLDAAKSAVVYKDDSGEYTKDVYKEARIVDCGHIDTVLTGSGGVINKGLNEYNTSSGLDVDIHNAYTVQKLGTNSIRIGTPFVSKDGKRGVRFDDGETTTFYVEFDGDPKLTREGFGNNFSHDKFGNPVYTSCPQYKDNYNADGTPAYDTKEDGSMHPSIYGGYLHTRHYKGATPATPETPDDPE